MSKFLITENVKSVSRYLKAWDENEKEIRNITQSFGHTIEKIIILNEKEKLIGVVISGDIKTVAGKMMSNERIKELMEDGGVLFHTIKTQVYDSNPIRSKILSEIESSIARVLTEESTDEGEVIIHADGHERIETDICYR